MNDWKKYLLSSASVWYSAIHDVRADPPLNVAGCGSIVEILKSDSSYTLNWKFNPLHSAFPVTVNVALPPSFADDCDHAARKPSAHSEIPGQLSLILSME